MFKVIWIKNRLLWLFLFGVLLGCISSTPSLIEDRKFLINSPTPSIWVTTSSLVYPSPTSSVPILRKIFSINEVVCELFDLTISTSYILDEVIVGQDRQEDVEKLMGKPEEETFFEGIVTWWWGSKNNSWVKFKEGIVIEHDEPRFYLGEIIAKYGEPLQLVWSFPNVNDHTLWISTFLLYPEQGVFFQADGQQLQFSPQTVFSGSVILPSQFDNYLKEHAILSSPYFRHEVFDWPCSVSE